MFLNVLQQAPLNKTDYYPHVRAYYVYNTLMLTYHNDKLTYLNDTMPLTATVQRNTKYVILVLTVAYRSGCVLLFVYIV